MPRIAWFSPLAQNSLLKSAYFSRQVLSLLPSDWDLELFVDQQPPSDPALSRFPIYHYLRAFERHNEFPFDYFIYQLEENRACGFVDQALEWWPGAIFFHDINLSLLCSRRSTRDMSDKAVKNEWGQWVIPDEALDEEELRFRDWRGRGWSTDILDAIRPQGDEQIRLAGVCTALNTKSAEELARRGITAPIALSAFPIGMKTVGEVASDRHAVRTKLSIQPTEKVIGFAGRFAAEERVQLTLEAFAELATTTSELFLIWIVEGDVHEAEANRTLAKMFVEQRAIRERIRVVRSESIEETQQLLAACDLFAALRFTALRGISLATYAALSCSVPTIGPNFGSSSDIPANVIARVEVGEHERAQFIATAREILSNELFANALRAAARDYADTVLNPKAVVLDLIELLRVHGPALHASCDLKEGAYRAAVGELIERASSKLTPDSTLFSAQSDGAAAGRVEKIFRDFGWDTLR